MYHDLPRGTSFWLFLFSIDQDLADTTRKSAAPAAVACTQPSIPGSLEAVAVNYPKSTASGSASAASATAVANGRLLLRCDLSAERCTSRP